MNPALLVNDCYRSFSKRAGVNARYMINIIIESDRPWLKKAAVKETAARTLEMEGIDKAAYLNVLLTDNKRIREFNRRYLRRDMPTDVIAFCSKRTAAVNRSLKGFIGEIAISVDMAQTNARRYGISKEDELRLYVVHGILHLIGYDDESAKRRKVMELRQGRIHKEICASL